MTKKKSEISSVHLAYVTLVPPIYDVPFAKQDCAADFQIWDDRRDVKNTVICNWDALRNKKGVVQKSKPRLTVFELEILQPPLSGGVNTAKKKRGKGKEGEVWWI
jgi:hypothetical protein